MIDESLDTEQASNMFQVTERNIFIVSFFITKASAFLGGGTRK